MSEPANAPPFRLRAQLRARGERRRLARRLAFGLAGLAAFGATIAAPPAPRLLWNVSASAPIGLYAVVPGAPPERGDTVIARTPMTVRALAAQRRYIPANVPLVKRVMGVPGDHLCARGAEIRLNGRIVALRQARDGEGRLMPWWTGCRHLRGGEYLLLVPAAASFDGRYFGPVTARDIVGKAVPLWVR